MESLAKAILQKFEKKDINDDLHFELPIKTICGVNVSVEFRVRRYNSLIKGFVLVIVADDMCSSSSNNELIFYRNLLKDLNLKSITTKELIPCIEQILTIIPTLRYNKKTSQLTDEDFYGDEVVELFKFENTTTSCESCCVCHDLTNTTTECDHHLCLACMSSLKGYVDDDEYIRKCPLCRENISQLH